MVPKDASTPPINAVDAFIGRWKVASGAERANYQHFVTELCALLGMPGPDPARDDTRDNEYVFERRVIFRHGDGTDSHGFADCYRRGAFVLEAKKIRQAAGRAFDDAMLRARGQAEQYARALPAEEGRPPFLVVVDVGNAIELYAEFTRSGATYTPFPDPRSHRLSLEDLRDESVRERLRQVWLEPLALDPTRRSARVTREIAAQLAEIAKALEAAGHNPELVAHFLTRCLFTMFAEDVGLLPKRAFVDLLESLRGDARQFVPLVGELWKAMDAGAFSAAIRMDVLKFNGKLFKDPHVIPLDRDQIALLLEAAKFNWREVEPAIFGTLLERALSPEDRHKLGAHYTPRAYVERLVLPTVVEPLREDWGNAQAAALVLAGEGKLDEARKVVRAFHHSLCKVRVLDPACGSGNFLYVTLEHLKRLEGEVLNQLAALGETQGLLETEGVTVDPHQLLGLEINPRAAAISELVLWIGYLQWHFRTHGHVMPPQPVLRDFHNIEHRDAVLAYDRVEYVLDGAGVPVSRWDGKTYKTHRVTGEDVPDENARVPLERYVNPRKAEWPKADFVVGNPPFVGTRRMRLTLGDGYVNALMTAAPEVPENADYVMYWWDYAAELARTGLLRRFGFITTNSIVQTFNRATVLRHLSAKSPISLDFAIPDHPWVDSESGAAVRIAMTVAAAGTHSGQVVSVEDGETSPDGEVEVKVHHVRTGVVQADLRVGASPASAVALLGNARIGYWGVKFYGDGFVVTRDEVARMRAVERGQSLARPFVSGRDLTGERRMHLAIDCDGLSEEDVRIRFPATYQRLLDRVKPVREHNPRAFKRERWWIFGENQPGMRHAVRGLVRYIATTETAKHRFFEFLPAETLAEGTVAVIGLSDAYFLGVLSSQVHVTWALAAGGRLGVGNDPRYNKTRCFETFPFPSATSAQQTRIRELAEELDGHRKRQQAAHPDLTLTHAYNVLAKLKSGDVLTGKEKVTHEHGLVSVLKQLHDELDLAVLDAYGWSDLASLMQIVTGNAAPGTNGMPSTRDECKRALDDALLERLVALNAERAAQEKRGLVRWLRPEFQHPEKTPIPTQVEIETPEEEEVESVAAKIERAPWPKELPDQVRRVADVLTAAGAPLTEDAIADYFTGRGPWKRRLPQIVETLVSVGRARRVDAGVIASP
jgi:hypothetical protein